MLKPRNTHLNPRATVYKRYTNTEIAEHSEQGLALPIRLSDALRQLGVIREQNNDQVTIGRYQVNQYYYHGTFDYTIRGDVPLTTTQWTKGGIMPLSVVTIKYVSDDIKLMPQDLVVINNRLYSVESVTSNYKQMPKRFTIYFATLNSIL